MELTPEQQGAIEKGVGLLFALGKHSEANALRSLLDPPTEQRETAMQRYAQFGVEDDDLDPVERLRAFCSLAMNGQDWCDVEPFFDAIIEQRMSDAASEEQPSWTNPMTPYGMLVRALRIVAGTTLMDMATFLGRGPAELSALEFGRRTVTNADIVRAAHYFASLGIQSTTHALTLAAARKAEIERKGES
jgi:hypothetical protein